MSDKLTETLEALGRRERPGCPWCGMPLALHADEHGPGRSHVWDCGTVVPEDVSYIDRKDACYDRELAALRAENERLHGLLDWCIDWAPILMSMEEVDAQGAKGDA